MSCDGLSSKTYGELIEEVDGKEIETVWGKRTLALKDLPVQKSEMSWRYRVLDTLSNPNIAYILMMLGFYGLFFELSNPGVIFPGVFGAICLILAFFALQTLPVNYAGVLLILLAIVLFIAEIKVISYGVLPLGGVVALLLGSLMLIESPDPALRVSWYVIVPMVATTAGFFLFAVSFALRAQMRQPTTGQEGLIGKRVKVMSPIKPEGKVFVHGEYWNAESEEEFERSERFLEEQGFLVNYVFKYDPRPGTAADARRSDDVPEAVKKERNQRLLAVAERVQRRRFAAWVGRTTRVLVESVSERDQRVLLGRNEHGMPASFEGDAALVGGSVEIVVDEVTAYGMAGRLAQGAHAAPTSAHGAAARSGS